MSIKINPMLNPMTTDINGPINILRMEGKINNVDKVIYLFMDEHLPVNEQSQCKNIFSIDIQKYFAKNFYHLSDDEKIYDFFLEIHPTRVSEQLLKGKILDIELKERYIDEVMKFFRKIFNYDKNKNKVIVNDLFKNVRLHYLDVRSYYKQGIQQKLFELDDIVNKMIKLNDINSKNLQDIINILNFIKKQVQYIIQILSDKTDSKFASTIIKPQSNILDTEAIEYLTYKLKNSYKNENVKDAMHKLIDQSINNFKKINTQIDTLINQYNNYILNFKSRRTLNKNSNKNSIEMSKYDSRKVILQVYDQIQDLINDKITEFFARFTDIYFLRRFLDKEYITNAIVYTGAYHSNTYVYTLVNLFNFKVTHITYSTIANIDHLNRELKKSSPYQIEKIIMPNINKQCANTNGFPEKFL